MGCKYTIHQIWLKVSTFLIIYGIIFTKFCLEKSLKINFQTVVCAFRSVGYGTNSLRKSETNDLTKKGMVINMKYAHRLKDLREDRDLTQSDIAKVLGTTYQYYSTYEAGKREMPFSRAIKLAEYYNVSLDYLAGLIETPRKLN